MVLCFALIVTVKTTLKAIHVLPFFKEKADDKAFRSVD